MHHHGTRDDARSSTRARRDRGSRSDLVEKPLAASTADARRLLDPASPCAVRTLFHAAADGARVVLDHQSGIVLVREDGVADVSVAAASRARLDVQYEMLLRAALNGDHLVDRATDRRLHELVLMAASR
jgi:hypothetical protein